MPPDSDCQVSFLLLCPYEGSFLWKHPGQYISCHLNIPSTTLLHGRWVKGFVTHISACSYHWAKHTARDTRRAEQHLQPFPSLPEGLQEAECGQTPNVQKGHPCSSRAGKCFQLQHQPRGTGWFLCCRFLSSLHNSVLLLRHQSQQRFHLKQPQLPSEQCQAWGHTWPRLLHKAHSQCTASLLSKGLQLGLLHTLPSARLTPATALNWLQSSLKSSGFIIHQIGIYYATEDA